MNQFGQSPSQVDIDLLKEQLRETVSGMMEASPPSPSELSQRVKDYIEQAYESLDPQLNDSLKNQIVSEIMYGLIGFGPLQPLLDDPEISEIMVNGIDKIYVERKGKISRTDVAFVDNNHLMNIINRIVQPLGRFIDKDNPTVDARLPDGSRVNAAIPPVMIDGPCITIRKFQTDKFGFEQLIEIGSITKKMIELLRACVIGKCNILISGGTGSGKTTLLNILSSFIPSDERIITIEDAAELQLQQEHVLRMETKLPNMDGRFARTCRDLVKNSLRMRPDRIVVGECRGGEAMDMLQAMNTGHDGSMTTVHSNSPRDSIARLETLCLMSGLNLPIGVIRKQIAAAIDVVIQTSRLRDGSRKVTSITEISGMEGEIITMTEIFTFTQTNVDQNGLVIGELKATGARPFFTKKLQEAGLKLGHELFTTSGGSTW
jgi:pilus assembly protein CpaF